MKDNHLAASEQASIVRRIGIGRDRSILFYLEGGWRLQLSVGQIAILRAISERGEVRSRDLHAIVEIARYGPALATGGEPATASQRASLSRAVRRLDQQSLIYRTASGTLACGDVGKVIAQYLALREATLGNVNRAGSKPCPVNVGSKGGMKSKEPSD